MVWEAVLVHLDFLISGLDILSLERRLSYQKRVYNHPDRPGIDLVGMALFARKDLRSNVVRSTTDCPFTLTFKCQLCRQAEVSELYLELFREKQVSQFQISMDHSMVMKIFNSVENLDQVTLDL